MPAPGPSPDPQKPYLPRPHPDPWGPIAGRCWALYAAGLLFWLWVPFDLGGAHPRSPGPFQHPGGVPAHWSQAVLQDIGINVAFFVPLGFLGAARRRRRCGRGGGVGVVLAGTMVAALGEGSQHWLPPRVSTWVDLLCNGIGVAVGVLAHLWWWRHVHRHHGHLPTSP